MLFVEYRFLVFFIVVLGVYWALRWNVARKIWLLATSYVFYAGWDWRFLGLIIASTLLDYTVAWRLSLPRTVHRRRWLMVSVVGQLTLLGFFKYCNFFVTSLRDFLHFLGVPFQLGTLEIILPVGISFYTFQTLSYTIDVYRGTLKGTKNLLDIALFVAFFPQLVAGPILRARAFLPQLHECRRYASVDVRGCLVIFLIGFVKKACISDNLAPLVDVYFASPQTYTALSSWIGVLAYAVQIYCDFSGYSDMAIGCAGLLGYRLMLNFDFPYLARNISEFWRRWHISLSSWLRDYLYYPMVWNRGGKYFVYRGLMVTMLLGGLWHGAAWNFVIWGGLHGVALIFHREGVRLLERLRWRATLLKGLGPFLTFYWVCIAWIFFRSVGAERSWTVLKAFVLFRSDGVRELNPAWLAVIGGLAIVHWLNYILHTEAMWRKVPRLAFAAAYGIVAAIVLAFVPTTYVPFIYFQF
ncbi:MAG: MBOAT family protein [Planctomycetota bacterium]